MARVILYIAASLDGFIARRDGGIDWLPPVDPDGEDYGYGAFYASVDAIILGRKTYEQALAFGDWPYPGKPSIVFTRRALRSEREDIQFTRDAPDRVVDRLHKEGRRRIWLVGGAKVAAAFLARRRIDEIILTLIPVLLGDGIPLFAPPHPEARFTLKETRPYPSGLVQLVYRRKR